jgi:hypothetical protein
MMGAGELKSITSPSLIAKENSNIHSGVYVRVFVNFLQPAMTESVLVKKIQIVNDRR